MRWLFGVVAALAIGAAGCGTSDSAGVPKSPVPMEKPGKGVAPGGAKGNPQLGEQTRILPK